MAIKSDSQTGVSANPVSLWRHGDFLKLWSGQTISRFGSAITGLALEFVAVVTLDATAAEMGLLAAIAATPSLVIGLFAGVWVDRFRRRSLMIVTDVLRALVLASVPAAAVMGVLSMAQLYVVGFISGTLSLVFQLAARSYLPAVIGRDHLVEGNAKLSMTNSIMGVAGHGAAGGLIHAITAVMALAVDALTYLLSAVCLLT